MEYKNLYSYKDFLNEKNNPDMVNEGLFKWLKGLFKDLQKYAEKIKESKEIDKKIAEFKKEADTLFEDQLQDQLKDAAAEILKSAGANPVEATQTTEPAQSGSTTAPAQSGSTQIGESLSFGRKLFEAQDDADAEAQKKKQEEEKKRLENLSKETKREKVVYKNPIDEAIGEFINNKKDLLKIYLTSKNEKVLLYAQAKVSELNQYILQKKVEFYKKNRDKFGDEGLTKVIEAETKKLKDAQTKSQEIMKKLGLAVGETTKDIVKGEQGSHYMYPSEGSGRDIKIKLIEDQDNITDPDKKNDNKNNDEGEKWVKIDAGESQFYVKKGVLKKIKPTEETPTT